MPMEEVRVLERISFSMMCLRDLLLQNVSEIDVLTALKTGCLVTRRGSLLRGELCDGVDVILLYSVEMVEQNDDSKIDVGL